MSEEQQEELKRTEKERPKEKKSYKKPLIVCVVILVILVILGLIIYFIVNSQDKEAQVKEFKKSIEKKDYDKLSNLLTTNEKNVTKQDAQHFVNYLHQDNNKEKFDKQISKIESDFKNKSQYNEELGELKDNNNRTYIKIKKRRQAFFSSSIRLLMNLFFIKFISKKAIIQLVINLKIIMVSEQM